MKRRLCTLLLLSLLPVATRADEGDGTPEIDPKKIINDSKGFLLNREPEMNAAEYALYEKVVAMLDTNPDFAVKLLEGMMTSGEKPSPAFEFILGNAYYALHRVPEAEKYYRSAVERYPEFLRAWNNLAVVYYSTEKWSEAARCFAKAVNLGDRSSQTYGLLGYSLEKNGDAVGAEAAYLQAVAGDAEHSEWAEGLLRLYIDSRQYVRSKSLLHQLIKNRPTEPRYWSMLAGVHVSAGEKMEAIAVAENARALGLADHVAILNLGDLYADQGLSKEAVEVYASISNDFKKLGAERCLRLASHQIHLRHYDEAAGALRVAEASGDATLLAKAALVRADLLTAQGKWSEAHQLLEEHLRKFPLDGRALVSYGRILLNEEQTDKAMFQFEQALAINDATYPASIELANIELKRQHYGKAAEHAERALLIERTLPVEQFLARVRLLASKAPLTPEKK